MASDLDELYDRHAHSDSDAAELAEKIQSYLNEAVEIRVVEAPTEPRYSCLVRLLKEPPSSLRIKAGMLINELRTILDSLAFTLAERNGHKSNETVYFPISKSEEVFKTDGYYKMRRLSDADKATIERLRPFKEGDEILWNLHNLDRRRKHWKLNSHGVTIGPHWSCLPSDGYGGHSMPHPITREFQQFMWFNDPRLLDSRLEPMLYFSEYEAAERHYTADSFVILACKKVGDVLDLFKNP